MSEVFRPYDDSEEKAPLKEKETDAVETEEKIQRTFIDMMLIVRTELQEAGYTLRRETTDSKAGTEFKGRSTEDVKDDTREKGERRIEGILKK
jgi:hypothetical protein